MPFPILDYQAIRDAILRDIANQRPEANTAEDGDYAIRANADAAAIEGLYQHQAWIVRQIFADTADTAEMQKQASLRGLTPKEASAATGTVTFSGTPGAAIPAGTPAKSVLGVEIATTVAASIDVGGTAVVPASATVSGPSGNLDPGTIVTLTSPPPGVASAAVVVSMTGGADEESPASLLARLLFIFRNPPAGGASHDYYIWAIAVPGVDRAYIYPLRRGPNTVDVVILAAGGLPSLALIDAAQAEVDVVRPVAADALVLGPAAVPVAVTAAIALAPGYTSAVVEAAIDTALAAYFDSLAPGDTVYRSRLSAILSGIAGVLDFTLTAPAANVTTLANETAIQLPTLGTTTWTWS